MRYVWKANPRTKFAFRTVEKNIESESILKST
uniref:Uncharacterized protein n=1 Tax=virus sp. ctah610 TaxID=2826807 RepID=A0A8S5R6N4_9VIRU|nr:MAG TPA: hypothetical protein [virus sp. ctah610]DAP56656.1 MAG TPA: hypothetical protein [Caudoviricetes sp.]